jgi:PAS domain S-box-containing protein
METDYTESFKSNIRPILTGLYYRIPVVAVGIIILYAVSIFNFYVFLVATGLIAVVLASSVFMVGWNTRNFVENNFVVFLGLSFMFVGVLNAGHTIVFALVDVIPGYSINASSQLYIACRYMQAISFLIAPIFLVRKLRDIIAAHIYIFITILIFVLTYFSLIPACYIEGSGFTLFYRISEYIIIILFTLSLLFLVMRRKRLNKQIFIILIIATSLAIIAELFFILSTNGYDHFGTLGHLFRLGCYYFVFFALVRTALVQPYEVLFHNLKLSEKRFRLITNNARDVIYKFRLVPDFKCEYISPAVLGITGYKTKDFYADNSLFKRIVHKEDLILMESCFKPDNIKDSNFQIRWLHKDGRVIWMEQVNSAVYDNDGKLTGIEGIARDISKRKEMEEALKNERDMAQKYLDIAGVIILVLDIKGNITLVNKKGCQVLGFEEHELTGKNWLDNFVPEQMKGEVKNRFKKLIAGEAKPLSYYENWIKTATNKERLIAWNNSILTDNESNIIGTLSSGEDITDRRNIEQDLHLKAALLENASNAIFVHDADGKFLYINAMACNLYGYSYDEFMRLNLQSLVPQESRERVRRRIRETIKKSELYFETVHLRKDGSSINLETHAKLFESGGEKYLLSVSLDVTERQKMRESLMLTDRLSSLGEMAMGVSHELNNPLTSVVGYTQLLMEEPDISEDMRQDLQKVHSQAKRAAQIIKDFITFARGQPTNKVLLNINNVIADVVKLRSYELGSKGIKVEMVLDPDIPLVLADQGQLQHCIWNILINAEHFMYQANKGGKFIVKTETDNNWIKIILSDNGPGITRDVLPHIFDPFYTTKDIGKGSGLGLSICYGIITQHGGRIYVESEEGKGATFIIELPVTRDVQ